MISYRIIMFSDRPTYRKLRRRFVPHLEQTDRQTDRRTVKPVDVQNTIHLVIMAKEKVRWFLQLFFVSI